MQYNKTEIGEVFIMFIRKLHHLFFAFTAALFLIVSSLVPVQATDPTITLSKHMVFLTSYGNDTVTFTTTGDPEVTADDPLSFDFTADHEHLVDVTVKDGEFWFFADGDNFGHAVVYINLNGSFVDMIDVYVYDDSDMYFTRPMNTGGLLSEGKALTTLNVEPIEARYAPVKVKTDDPSVAVPEEKIMAACDLRFDLIAEGIANITVETETRMDSFELESLGEGNYAEDIRVKDDEYEIYIKKGSSIENPFILYNYAHGCEDDFLRTEIIQDSEGFGDNGVVTIQEDGSFKGNRNGYAEIAARSRLGQYASVYVYVYEKPEKLSFGSDTYYINQNNDWILEPELKVEPETLGFLPIIYTSTDPDIVRIGEYETYEYISDGEVKLRAAYRDDPSIYAECKVIAFTAKHANTLKTVSEVTVYPEYEKEVDLTFEPYASYHNLTSIYSDDEAIATAENDFTDTLSIEGHSIGTTTIRLKSGSKAKADIKVKVVKGAPKSEDKIMVGHPKTAVDYPDDVQDMGKEFTFIKGEMYMIDAYREFEEGYYYIGGEDLLKTDLEMNLLDSGLFTVQRVDIQPDDHMVWFTASEAGTSVIEPIEGTDVKVTVIEPTGGVDMYRLYNPNSGEHFYTAKEKEKNALVTYGWKYEGIGWTAPDISYTPVFRLYNANSGDHHYTMKVKERDALIGFGWKDEGIGWYSDDAKKVPLFREYNPNMSKCNHNYTTKKAEHDYLTTHGWNDEGIGWYGVK